MYFFKHKDIKWVDVSDCSRAGHISLFVCLYPFLCRMTPTPILSGSDGQSSTAHGLLLQIPACCPTMQLGAHGSSWSKGTPFPWQQ